MSETTTQLVNGRLPADTPERRTASRFVTACEASSSPVTARETKVSMRVRDVSTGGIGLVSPRRFERGTMLFIEILGSREENLALLVGRVAHVSAHAPGGWLIGCELGRPLTWAEVKAILDSGHTGG
jgi:hypothetical protein